MCGAIHKIFTLAVTCFFGAAALAAVPLPAEGGRLGLGMVAGNPAGISASFTGGPRASAFRSAAQASAAWDLVSPGGLVVSGDWLFLFDRRVRLEGTDLPFYAGIGVKATLLAGMGRYGTSDAGFGLTFRLPLGMRWDFGDPPLEAFAELVPGFLLYPSTGWDAGAGIGLRWLF